ncbi:MAG: voltage-gated chloride channel family protein [Rikenellaceae bacterium]
MIGNKKGIVNYLIKWTAISAIVGICVGCASAIFLLSLDWATSWRENNIWIISLLPIGGLIIGLLYHYYSGTTEKGNNLIIDEFYSPRTIIPFRMAPLVLVSTVITHFFGGSAGREGTAVQMGGAIADRLTRLFKLNNHDRKTILIVGVSSGFASVFGTPLAGAVFALEVMVLRHFSYKYVFPSFLVAFIANYVCVLWGVHHTTYSVSYIPQMSLELFLWSIAAGLLFGVTAMLFTHSIKFFSFFSKRFVPYPPLRPFFGGIIIAGAVFIMGTTKYIGLGMPTIVSAFQEELPYYDFILKIAFTAFTLGVGFKGGEVTPLFFIGATLGNVLSLFMPLPMALLAAMGFVSLFAGATNTPIACAIMGMELFGIEGGVFIAVACIVAYLSSGDKGIYSSQDTKMAYILHNKGK